MEAPRGISNCLADPAQHAALLAEAEQALALDETLVKDLTHFSDSPQLLRATRAAAARLIERAEAAVGGR